MRKIKWGVIGCGGIADIRTIPGMLLAENAELTAVMDRNAEVSAKVGKKYGVFFTDSMEEFLRKDIDAVYIATPVFCHKEQVLLAADAGKHILLEKPMGMSAEDGIEMAKYCREHGVLLGVGFMMRLHGAHKEIKKLISLYVYDSIY